VKIKIIYDHETKLGIYYFVIEKKDIL